ncbi:prealbumin-like fold domain-containing protein [[Clostridium] innocuum]|uniref:prealbumin-like fold domain-containing protein n=1 Tax=Clostridium innocuum TaxID=1522 RepID=UPI00325A2BAA
MKKIKMIMIILCTAIFIAMGLSIKVNAKNAVSVMDQKSLDDVSSEEKGPIDDIDKVKGVRQIMAAGVIDENFASAIYDAFQKEGFYGDDTKTIREILGEYSKSIDASNRGIKSIQGIEWLRNTRFIELGNKYDALNPEIKNEISDLSPLSIEYINRINPSSDDVLKWFKNKSNLEIQLGGNPIKNYGKCVGGLQLTYGGRALPLIQSNNLTAIKLGKEKNWKVVKNIRLPELKKDGFDVTFSGKKQNGNQPLTRIEKSITTVNSDAEINYEELNKKNLQIDNIKHSGDLWATLGHEAKDAIDFFKYNSIGGGVDIRLDPDYISYSYETTFRTRIYTPVIAESIAKANIKVTKLITENKSGIKRVKGAKYYLYNANTNSRFSDKQYITDENGEFMIVDNLPSGDYYLLEFEAPNGFNLNKNKVKFSIFEDNNGVRVTGGDKNLNVNAGNIQEDVNVVYIDRYSNDVEVKIEDIPDAVLDHVEMSYIDRETQKEKEVEITQSFLSAQEASAWLSNWINVNKGNAENIGSIDGEVKIKVYYTYTKKLITSDSRSVTNVDFNKKGSYRDDDKNIVSPLAGAKFKLVCTHKHDENCKSKDGKYSNCSDAHSDYTDFITERGCNWSSEAISNKEGKVLFTNINSGVYELTETKVPEGYKEPKTSWTVIVDAANDKFTIEEDNVINDCKLEWNQMDGFTIINEKRFQPVIPDEPTIPNTPDKPIYEETVKQNTPKTEQKIKFNKNAKTGDYSDMSFWSLAALISVITILIIVTQKSRNAKNN